MHAQSCPTLWDPMDCSPPGSSVHGIIQARILERVAISYSTGSSQTRDRTCISCIFCSSKQVLYHCTTWEAHETPVMWALLLSPLCIESTEKFGNLLKSHSWSMAELESRVWLQSSCSSLIFFLSIFKKNFISVAVLSLSCGCCGSWDLWSSLQHVVFFFSVDVISPSFYFTQATSSFILTMLPGGCQAIFFSSLLL